MPGTDNLVVHVHSLIIATLFPSTDRTIPAVNNPNNASRHNTALQMCSAPSSSGPFPVNAATTSPIYTDHTCAHCSQSAVEIILLKRAERNLQDRLKSMEADLTRHKKQMEQDEEKIKKLEKEAVTNRTERGKQEKRNKDLEKTAATHKTEREEQVRQIQKLQKEATAYRTEREEQAKRIQGLESEAAAYKAEKESQIALLQAKIDLADRDKTIALQQLRLELSRPAQDSTRPESTTSASASPSWTTSACDLTSAAQPSPHQNGPRQLPHRYGPRPQPYRSGPRSHPHRFGPVKAKETVLANKDNAHKLELAAKEKDITAKNQEITAKETALANKDKAHKLELESMNNALESMKNANKVELLELRLELSTKDKRISVHDLQLRLRDNHIQMLKTELAKAHVDRPLPAPVPAPPPAAPAAPAPASIDESIAQDYAQDYEDYVHGAVQVQHLADVAQDEPSDLPRPEELISRLLDAAQARSLHGSTPATDRFFFETLAACIKDRDLIGSCRRAGRTRPLLGSAKQYTRLGSNTVDAILGIGVRTLEDWQPAGDGAVPAFVRLARLVISAENEIERQKREMEEEQRRAEAEQEEEEEEEEEMIE
ncbi:hypothetical protein FFLO_05006 [Filobasidium floriforme]|uniref:Uncharacterized protein n=1 Tax=Filobasidium floriforme TaxID=5210 RepID=A0A8K0JJV0_9TREE|nr:uncharacterized protein HD553DRAFT_308431 [Filobasidium floriforme]KAG7530465.1 hypothetical protein FFLO_05006 [Filobasidium floriforme]KAH8087554.1 hypothetical protein HD553DRAFT_308431 [Filobasidium floriforme]